MATKKIQNTMKMTDATLDLFIAYANDAPNWSGSPLVGEGGNVSGENVRGERGNLSHLKRAGLVETVKDGPGESPRCTWLYFTPKGIVVAATLGIDLTWVR